MGGEHSQPDFGQLGGLDPDEAIFEAIGAAVLAVIEALHDEEGLELDAIVTGALMQVLLVAQKGIGPAYAAHLLDVARKTLPELQGGAVRMN